MRNCLEKDGDKLSNYTIRCDVSGHEKDLFQIFFLSSSLSIFKKMYLMEIDMWCRRRNTETSSNWRWWRSYDGGGVMCIWIVDNWLLLNHQFGGLSTILWREWETDDRHALEMSLKMWKCAKETDNYVTCLLLCFANWTGLPHDDARDKRKIWSLI